MIIFNISIYLFSPICLLMIAVFSVAAVPNVPPEIVSQLKSMSPAQQRALARQYGFDLEVALGGNKRMSTDSVRKEGLGAPGEPVEQSDLPDLDESETRELSEESEDKFSEQLERFGSGLFDSDVSTFAPVDNIPVPEGYRLGVGDELRVMLIGAEQGDFPLIIDRDGSITLPKLGARRLEWFILPRSKKFD